MNTRSSLKVAAGAAAGLAIAAGVRAIRSARSDSQTDPHSLADGRRAYLRGVTVNRKPEDVYAFWRDLTNLSRVIDRVRSIERVSDTTSRWLFDGPLGTEIGFTAEIVDDEPSRVIAWRSTDSPVPHEGRVEFAAAPGNRGAELRVGVVYKPPVGMLGVTAAKITGEEPDHLLRDALRRVKQILEAGEVVSTEGQPSARGPVKERLTELVTGRVAAGGRA